MTDIERIELAIRRVLDTWARSDQPPVGPIDLLTAVADELARMRERPVIDQTGERYFGEVPF